MSQKFDFEMFTSLMASSPKRALEYRDKCHEWLIKKEEVVEETIVTETTEDWINVDDFTEDEVEFTRADLIEKLNTAWIKFMPNSKDETLLQKCITNNLMN
jgi:hypothetical protein